MWQNVTCIPSSDTNVRKYVFTNEGEHGAVAEAVLYKYPTYDERTVVCFSVMSGCPMGCRFCGTGEFFIRTLTADEIASLDTQKVYSWVRQGAWKTKHFNKWLKVMRVIE